MSPRRALKCSLIAVLLPIPVLCATPFAGTWTVQPALTEFSGKSLGLSISAGVYKRTSCSVTDEVPADGTDHPLSADPFFDAMSVRVLDRRTAEVVQKTAGRVTWRGRYGVARDLRSMTLRYEDRRATNAVTGEIRFEREESAAPESHALTGNWRPVTVMDLSPTALTLAFQDTEGGLIMRAADGRSFDIKFGPGSNEPLQGYLPGAMVHLGRRAPDTLQMNRTQNGTLVEFTIGTVAEDGQSMALGQTDWQCQLKTSWLLRKQPAS